MGVMSTRARPQAVGRRFLMVRAYDDEEAATLILVQNFFEELKRLVPTGD